MHFCLVCDVAYLFFAMITTGLITNILIGAAIAVAAAVCILIVLARRATVGSTVDLSKVTVSRQWLIEHQSIDQS